MNIGIKLFEHNQTAYNSVLEMLAEQRQKRRGKRNTVLTDEQIRRLDSIGMNWGSREEHAWKIQFDKAREYYLSHGDLNISKDYISPSGRKTRYWLEKQKSKFRKGTLSNEQIDLRKTINYEF